MHIFRPKKPNEHFLGFERETAPFEPMLRDSIAIDGKSFYFAGADGLSLYLGNRNNPLQPLKASHRLNDTIRLYLDIDSLGNSTAQQVRIVDRNIYLLDGNLPSILKGHLADATMRPWINGTYFLAAEPFSRISAAVMARVNDVVTLGKLSALAPRQRLWFPDVVEKQLDGFFASYGQLRADIEGSRIVYVYSNINKFTVLDTNMHLIYHARTIDTISMAKIKTSESKNIQTLASPPMPVNLQSRIAGNSLFIHSNIRAENETRKRFLSSAPIDVYDLDNGHYLHTFYIPNRHGEKIIDFTMMDGRTAIALYRSELIRYEICAP